MAATPMATASSVLSSVRGATISVEGRALSTIAIRFEASADE